MKLPANLRRRPTAGLRLLAIAPGAALRATRRDAAWGRPEVPPRVWRT
jgi:hypothetical protein